MSARRTSDRNLLLMLAGGMLVLLIGVTLLVRGAREDDPVPSITNTGPAGAKAAFLTLQALGRNVTGWYKPPTALASVDAAHTTLIVAQPDLRVDQQKDFAAAFQQFLNRGGRVLVTGADAASLLPGGAVADNALVTPALCRTTPEGPGPLAAVGEVEMADHGGWTAHGPQFRVEQRCQAHPVVVRFPVGAGEAVWWSSSTPLSNAGMKNETGVKLLLASIDSDPAHRRAILFDEYLHTTHGEYHPLAGLPLWWIAAQFVAAFALLVFSFSRRKGPLRLPAGLPRSSPVEFANSMGDLYDKAHATSAATDAAHRRLLRVLHHEAGIPKTIIDAGATAIAETLTERLGGDWVSLAQHLDDARAAHSADLAPRSALALVRALAADEAALHEKLNPPIKTEQNVSTDQDALAMKE